MTLVQDLQTASELAVFRQFLQCVGSPCVRLDSIEKRSPPEPDILCEVERAGSIAFELVEIVESGWAQLVNDHIRLEKALYLANERQAVSRENTLFDLFADGLVYVRFCRRVAVGQRERSISALFEFLVSLPRHFVGHASPDAGTELASSVSSIAVSRGEYCSGPFFQVEAVDSIGDPTVERIQAKWNKRYATRHPVELLAYYDLHPTIPQALWIKKLRSFVEMNWATAPFNRVWICDLASKQVLFVASAPRGSSEIPAR